jgi:hypothetical protein
LSNTLKDFALDDDAGRKQVVDQILATDTQYQEARRQRQHFDKWGAPPPAVIERRKPIEALKQIDFAAPKEVLLKERNNLRTVCSKLKKKIAASTDPNAVKSLQEKLEYNLKLLKQIDEQVN